MYLDSLNSPQREAVLQTDGLMRRQWRCFGRDLKISAKLLGTTVFRGAQRAPEIV